MKNVMLHFISYPCSTTHLSRYWLFIVSSISLYIKIGKWTIVHSDWHCCWLNIYHYYFCNYCGSISIFCFCKYFAYGNWSGNAIGMSVITLKEHITKSWLFVAQKVNSVDFLEERVFWLSLSWMLKVQICYGIAILASKYFSVLIVCLATFVQHAPLLLSPIGTIATTTWHQKCNETPTSLHLSNFLYRWGNSGTHLNFTGRWQPPIKIKNVS